MNRLRRQALLYFLGPLALMGGLLVVAWLVGRLPAALLGGLKAVDLLWLLPLLAASLLPPGLGYRLVVRLGGALSDTAEAIRRLGEGKAAGAWVQMAAEVPELLRSVDETALQLRERVESLLEEKGKLDAILTHMSEGVVLVDDRRKVISINPAAEQIFGLSRADALGRDHLELTHNFQLEETLNEVMKSGQPASLEFTRARPVEQVLECRLAPIASASGVLMVLHDITRFRRLERVRTEFVANVSHELRTPLTAIRGFAETLLEGAAEDAEARRRFLVIMKEEAMRLERLIADLLDLSRIESGRMRMDRSAVDLAELIRSVTDRLAVRAGAVGVDLRIEVPAGLPPVSGDAGRLAQVLVNLVENGIKYTGAGGSVLVTARAAADEVAVQVADTGIGIDRADLPRVFERFYRVDKGRSRASGGTGLGLSIVKHIVEAHRGRVWADSEKGKGATFTFTIPVAN